MLALCATAAAEPLPRSGVYDSLTLAVEGGAVSGVFAEERGGADGMPSFSCIFLLRGRLAGVRAEVETWFPGEPERIRGSLAFTPEGAALTLAEDHGGWRRPSFSWKTMGRGCPSNPKRRSASSIAFSNSASVTAAHSGGLSDSEKRY